MPFLVGLILAAAVVVFARVTGLDRDRAFYPVVLIIVGSYYVLFAIIAGGAGLAIELGGFALFAAIAVAGFRTSLWIVTAGLTAHGVFDFVRDRWLPGQGVPEWWPGFCGGFDVAAAVLLAGLLVAAERKALPDV